MTDTSHEKALAQKLAEELIISIKAKVAPRAVLLETRIEKALDYLNSVDSANAATLRHARRFLDGEFDTLPFHDPAALVRGLFEKRWRCEVTASGYHNGAGCSPGEPHGGWNCGYRWMAPALTENEAREYGLITDTTEETTCPSTTEPKS